MQLFSEQTKRVKERRAICEACPNRVQNLVHLYVCNLCGCPIATKTLVPNTSCPDNPPKW